MASYLIKKNKNNNEIVYMSYDFDGYNFKPKNKNDRLTVNNVMIVKPAMIEKILYIKFNKLTNQYLIVISFHKQEYPLTYKFK